jgi:hypothetical protein
VKKEKHAFLETVLGFQGVLECYVIIRDFKIFFEKKLKLTSVFKISKFFLTF